MAKATIFRPAPPEATVTLTLTEAEANALAGVFSRVGGDPHDTRRGVIDRIADALRAVGIDWHDNADDITGGGIRFTSQ